MTNCNRHPEDIFQSVKKSVYNDDILQQLNIQHMGVQLRLLFDVMDEDIQDMKNDKDKMLSVGREQKATTVLNLICEHILNKKSNEDTVLFFKDLIFIIGNWYVNLKKNDKIESQIPKLLGEVNVLLDGNLTMRELVLLLLELRTSLRQIKNIEPPAFKISQHLLDYLVERR